jgi:hypothetical protein
MKSNGFGSERERAAILKQFPGILSRIARDLGMSPAAVSRTFHGITRETNPRIVEGIENAILFARAQQLKEVENG